MGVKVFKGKEQAIEDEPAIIEKTVGTIAVFPNLKHEKFIHSPAPPFQC